MYLRYIFLLLFSFSLTVSYGQNFRSYNGSGNNLDNSTWGATHEPLTIMTDLVYADGMSAPTGVDRPNPRTVSNMLFAQDSLLPDVMHLSDYCWVFGQFVDHDITLTHTNNEPAMISVPAGDPWFDPFNSGQVMIPMMRTEFMPGTGTSTNNPRQFPNSITSFLDGSAIYGSDQDRADWLRSFDNGKLKISTGNLLPYNTIDGEFGSAVDPNAPDMADDVGRATRLFVAGDVRANENPLLASFHTLFVREHNRICDELKAIHLNWRDERIFQEARKRTSAIFAAIIYEEWLPAMGVNLPAYSGYNSNLNPTVSNVFAAAAFRMGHTLLNGNVMRIDNDGQVLPEGNMELRDAFFNPDAIPEVGGIEPYIKGMGVQTQQSFDSHIIDDVRNFLFGPPGAGGLDLASVNINRGRERGLPDYNSIREDFGLTKVNSFSEINSNPSVANTLENLYGSVDDIDAWVGMLSEERMGNSLFGELVLAIMTQQFRDIRDGDRYYFENDPNLTADEIAEIKSTRLYDVIMRNTDVSVMQSNVFEAMPHDEICITQIPFADINGSIYREDGAMFDGVTVEAGEPGLTAVTTQVTNGNYEFLDLETCNNYNVKPQKAGTAHEGVSTLDIVDVLKHVQNVKLLDSPYKILAADVNGSGNVSTLDIVGIRKVVLRVEQDFPNEKVWSFVAASHQFDDVRDPWTEPVPEKVRTVKFDDDRVENFVGFKYGDVNYSFDPANANSIDDRTAGTIDLSANNQYLEAGQVVAIPVHMDSDIDIAGLQFTLNTKSTFVEILGIDGVALDNVNSTNYAMHQNGALTFSWNGELATDGALFEVMVRTTAGIKLSDAIQLTSQLTSAEGYDNHYNSFDINLNIGDQVAGQFELYQNQPNPFNGLTTIGFNLPKGSEATLRVFDISGRKIYEANNTFGKGYQSFEISSSDLGQSGIYHYQLNTDFGSMTRKLVIAN